MVDLGPHARDEHDGHARPVPRRWLAWARYGAAVLLAFAAVNHGVLAVTGVPSVGRHAAFVGINLVAAVLVVRLPRLAVLPLALLTLQQLASHGADLLRSLRAGSLDAASLGVVLFFPTLTALLIFERTRDTRARQPQAPRGP